MTVPGPRAQFGPFTLDPAERLLLKDGRVVPLTPKGFDLLEVLVRNAGRLLSKDELIKQVWPDTFVEESNLAYNVFTVRKALGESTEEGRYIETIPRRGYRFVAPVAAAEGGTADVGSSPYEVTAGESAAPRLGLRPSVLEAPVGALAAEGPAHRALEPPAATRRPWFAWSVATLAVIALAGLAVVHFSTAPAPAARMRFQIPLRVPLLVGNGFAISPNGRHLAFAGVGPDRIARLWVQDLETLGARPLSGTEKISIAPPFWAPDSATIAYDAGGQLMKVGLAGGAPQPLCHLPGLAVGGTWRRDVIVTGNAAGALMMCPAAGGTSASPVTAPSSMSGDEIHIFPSFLPDGQHLLYTRISRTAPENSGVFVASLAPGPKQTVAKRLIATGFGATYVDTSGDGRRGHVLFVRDGALFAQPFDARQHEPAGDPISVASPVGTFLDFAFFTVSSTGVLVFKGPDPDSELTWYDRAGRPTDRVGEPGRYSGLALSPDGRRAVVVKHAPKSTDDQDLWLFELSRDSASRKLTFAAVLERLPVWQGDSDRIVFSSGGGLSGVYEMSVSGNGPPEMLFQTGRAEYPSSVWPGARFLLYAGTSTSGGTDLWTYPLDRDHRGEPRPFISRELIQEQGQFSPDGRWVAYVSNESGPREVFVAATSLDAAADILRAGPGQQVSKGGGTSPRWSRGGTELFYLTADGFVSVIAIGRGAIPFTDAPAPLFQVSGALADWGVSPDGSRFLLAVPVRSPSPFDGLLHWDVGLPR